MTATVVAYQRSPMKLMTKATMWYVVLFVKIKSQRVTASEKQLIYGTKPMAVSWLRMKSFFKVCARIGTIINGVILTTIFVFLFLKPNNIFLGFSHLFSSLMWWFRLPWLALSSFPGQGQLAWATRPFLPPDSKSHVITVSPYNEWFTRGAIYTLFLKITGYKTEWFTCSKTNPVWL